LLCVHVVPCQQTDVTRQSARTNGSSSCATDATGSHKATVAGCWRAQVPAPVMAAVRNAVRGVQVTNACMHCQLVFHVVVAMFWTWHTHVSLIELLLRMTVG
jgi:hypothetical protein